MVSLDPEDVPRTIWLRACGLAGQLCLEHLLGRDANVAKLIYSETQSAVAG